MRVPRSWRTTSTSSTPTPRPPTAGHRAPAPARPARRPAPAARGPRRTAQTAARRWTRRPGRQRRIPLATGQPRNRSAASDLPRARPAPAATGRTAASCPGRPPAPTPPERPWLPRPRPALRPAGSSRSRLRRCTAPGVRARPGRVEQTRDARQLAVTAHHYLGRVTPHEATIKVAKGVLQRINQAQRVRLGRGLAAAGRAELAHDVGHVHADRLGEINSSLAMSRLLRPAATSRIASACDRLAPGQLDSGSRRSVQHDPAPPGQQRDLAGQSPPSPAASAAPRRSRSVAPSRSPPASAASPACPAPAPADTAR